MTESLPLMSAGPLAALHQSAKLDGLFSSKLTSATCLLDRAGVKQVRNVPILIIMM